MKKRMIKVIGFSLVFILVFVLDITIKNNHTEEKIIEVISVNKMIKDGSMITAEDISYVSMLEDEIKPYMATTTTQIVGKYTLRDYHENDIVSKHFFSANPSFQLASTDRLITIRCSVVESNGWQSKLYDQVDLIMVTSDETIIIEGVIVFNMFNETDDEISRPEYYTFAVNEAQSLEYYRYVKHSSIYISVK